MQLIPNSNYSIETFNSIDSSDPIEELTKSLLHLTIRARKMFITIKVKNLAGRICEISVDTEDTITKLKELIEEKEGIPPEQQRLIFGGRAIADDKKLSDYKIESGHTLHLVLSLRGGVSGVSELFGRPQNAQNCAVFCQFAIRD